MVRVPFTVGGQSVSLVTDFYGGIGNRITPMGCILSLAAELNYRPIVFWIANEVVGGANFGDLFETTNLPFELVGGYEARIMSCALSVYPRARGRTVMLKIRKKSLGLLSAWYHFNMTKKLVRYVIVIFVMTRTMCNALKLELKQLQIYCRFVRLYYVVMNRLDMGVILAG